MNIKRTKCENCDKELQPFESKTYCQSTKFGYYSKWNYFDLCKPCHKKWRNEDDRKIIQLVFSFIAIILITFAFCWIFIGFN